jgi:hypothetical protein
MSLKTCCFLHTQEAKGPITQEGEVAMEDIPVEEAAPTVGQAELAVKRIPGVSRPLHQVRVEMGEGP